MTGANELLDRAAGVMAIPWVDGEVYDVIRDLRTEVERMATQPQPLFERLEAIELRPDDVLLVTVPVHISREEANEIRAVVEAKLPGRAVLVKPVDVTIEAVRPSTFTSPADQRHDMWDVIEDPR